MKTTAFEKFAPAILQVYNRDKEAFWQAVMVPYLSKNKLSSMIKYRKTGSELIEAFSGLDENAQQILRDFSTRLGFDITTWKSYQKKAEYFKDAYPIFSFLVIWMHEEKMNNLLERFSDILRAAVYGIAGYGIMDVNMDEKVSSPVEVLVSQALIAEYEYQMLDVFGICPTNVKILHRIRSLFLNAEIREKSVRSKDSPYSFEKPEECGYKAAHLLTPFMLSLESKGKADLMEDYLEVFFLFGAVIQIIDDWKDLEEDLSVGHYSYVSLGYERLWQTKKPGELAGLIHNDKTHVREVYDQCKHLIVKSQSILSKLHDFYLSRIVDVVDLRLDSFFRKELRMPDD